MIPVLRASTQFVIVVLLALLMVGCVALPPAQNTVQAAHDFVSSHQVSSLLAPGDTVTVSVLGEDDLSGIYAVEPKGVLTLPLVGEIAVVGLTAESAANSIKVAYQKGYLLNPVVTLEKNLPPAIFVMGAVREPGSYPYVVFSTIMKAASLAGGFKEHADMARFDVVRGGRLIEADASTLVLPHDVIMVRQGGQP